MIKIQKIIIFCLVKKNGNFRFFNVLQSTITEHKRIFSKKDVQGERFLPF